MGLNPPSKSRLAVLLLLGFLAKQATSYKYFITQLADPGDDASARFVEVYTPDGASQPFTPEGQPTGEDMYLARWTNGSNKLTVSSVEKLTNDASRVFGADGFFIFCASESGFSLAYPSSSCDWEIGGGGPADSNGDDQVALIFAAAASIDSPSSIYDIFGVPGEDGSGTDHDFVNGRATRNVPLPATPSSTWIESEWTVDANSADTADITPRQFRTGTLPPTNPSCSLPTDGSCTSIEDIQGSTDMSPLDENYVTSCPAFVTAVVSDGFYLQQSVGTDPSKSDAIFVFTDDIPVVGDFLFVCGTVDEYFGLTELTDVTWSVDANTDGEVAPGYTELELGSSELESLESMLVDVVPASPGTNMNAVSEYFNLDRYGEFVVCHVDKIRGRIFQYSQLNTPGVAGYEAHTKSLISKCLTVDDNNSAQNPNPVKAGGLIEMNSSTSFRGGDAVTTLKGVLFYSFGDFKVQPFNDRDLVIDASTNPRPLGPPEFSSKKEYAKIAVSNVLNYFTSIDPAGGSSPFRGGDEVPGYEFTAEFDRQAQKTSLALSQIDADIFGIIEVENFNGGAILDLAARMTNLNADRLYKTASMDSGLSRIGTDSIRVDMIYDSLKYRIVSSCILTDAELPALGIAGPVFDGVNTNRVPFAVTFENIVESKHDPFTLVMNHFKSKGGSGTGVNDDIGDGSGNWNDRRTKAAKALLAWIDSDGYVLRVVYFFLYGLVECGL
jgi:predicted extracellular nuclease